jgi:hypothetical protein
VWGDPGADTTKPDVWLHDRLTKIELIVNGSKVVKSLSGEQLLAHMMYQGIPLYSHDFKNASGISAEEFFYINMGLKYHDLDYLLDLSKVSDPELRITYDFTKTSAHGWTNGEAMAASPVPKYSIIPHLLREPTVSPRGYIKTSEIYRFTSAASKKENMMIPRGPLYCGLYLQSWYASEGLCINLDTVELNFDNDALIPFRVTLTELIAEITRRYGLMKHKEQFYVKSGQAYPIPFECGEFHGRCDPNSPVILTAWDLWGCVNPFKVWDLATPSEITDPRWFIVDYEGALPFGVAAIPAVDPLLEWTWIDSSKFGNLWLKVEEAAGAGTNATIILLADEVVSQ